MIVKIYLVHLCLSRFCRNLMILDTGFLWYSIHRNSWDGYLNQARTLRLSFLGIELLPLQLVSRCSWNSAKCLCLHLDPGVIIILHCDISLHWTISIFHFHLVYSPSASLLALFRIYYNADSILPPLFLATATLTCLCTS